jgi:hypothetical protein
VIWSALIFTDRTIDVRSCCGEWTSWRFVLYRMAARCIRNGLNSGIARSRHFAARELDRETEVQTRFMHLFGDFSQPAISRHMSGNSADISKRYFRNCTVGSNLPWSAKGSANSSQRACRSEIGRYPACSQTLSGSPAAGARSRADLCASRTGSGAGGAPQVKSTLMAFVFPDF